MSLKARTAEATLRVPPTPRKPRAFPPRTAFRRF